MQIYAKKTRKRNQLSFFFGQYAIRIEVRNVVLFVKRSAGFGKLSRRGGK